MKTIRAIENINLDGEMGIRIESESQALRFSQDLGILHGDLDETNVESEGDGEKGALADEGELEKYSLSRR